MTVTSIRRGFAGRSMPKLIGERLRIPGAEKIPAGAMLFMGFTSSHVHGLAAGNLPSFETLPGYTDATPDSYFAHGTAMHLSHIAIDLKRWYEFSPQERLKRMFHPRRTETDEVLSPDQSPATSTFKAQRDDDVERYKLVGHNEQMQFLSRVEDGDHHRLRAETRTRNGLLPPARLQHRRESVRLRRPTAQSRRSRAPGCTSSASGPQANTSRRCAGRWTARISKLNTVSPTKTSASPRCSSPPTGKTSCCHRERTVLSRLPSCCERHRKPAGRIVVGLGTVGRVSAER